MRRFIYLDTDTINSYLAQIYDGLVKSEESEVQSSDSTQHQSQHTVSTTGAADQNYSAKALRVRWSIHITI